MSKKQPEGKIFDLKPHLTLAMKLAATFAITYYGLLLLYEIATVVFSRYFIDSVYMGSNDPEQGQRDYVVLVIQLALSVLLVFSLISIFMKKSYGKALFVGSSILLIIFQLFTTGFVPPLKYIIEVLILLVIAPLRVKKKIKIKKGKITVEEVENGELEAENGKLKTENGKLKTESEELKTESEETGKVMDEGKTE